MLARTKPNLLDLMVAVFAGFAGTFAMIDERVSPALPGVAIATAIVPPLSNTGLCLALGAYNGAFGSFMLFVANFFAILIVGALTFAAAGILQVNAKLSKHKLVQNFLFAVVGFLVVSALLTQSLVLIVKERRRDRIISNVVTHGLAQIDLPPYTLEEIVHNKIKDKVEVVVELLSSEIVYPGHVATLQNALTDALDRPTVLVVRTLPAHDMAATGFNAQIARPNLDGRLIATELSQWELTERIAEQYLYEELSDRLGLEIESISFSVFDEATPNILVALRTAIPFRVDEFHSLQDGLRERLNMPDLFLGIQSVDSSVYTDKGKYLVEWTNYDTVTDFEQLEELKKIIDEEVQRVPNLFVTDVHINEKKGKWQALAEVVGPIAPGPDQVAAIQAAVVHRFPHPVEVYAWFKLDTVITPDGYSAFSEFTQSTLERRTKDISEIFKRKTPKVIPKNN